MAKTPQNRSPKAGTGFSTSRDVKAFKTASSAMTTKVTKDRATAAAYLRSLSQNGKKPK